MLGIIRLSPGPAILVRPNIDEKKLIFIERYDDQKGTIEVRLHEDKVIQYVSIGAIPREINKILKYLKRYEFVD